MRLRAAAIREMHAETLGRGVVAIGAGKLVHVLDVALGLGCCCGARTTTAGLPAVQDALESKLPALGYTVTYAVGNTLLIICGIIIVFLMN